jgi:hypothetical protein
MRLYFKYLAFLILITSSISNGQPAEKSKIYLSVCLGPSITGMNYNFAFSNDKLSGPSLQMDLKAGFGLSHNLFLNVNYMVNKLSNPNIKMSNGYGARPSDEIAIRDRMVGGGFTWYPIKELYLSASVGPGTLKVIDKVDELNSAISDRGLSMQFSIGREWPVSKSFGMGFCFTYGFTKTKNLTYSGDEAIKSNRFGLLYSVSMH